MRESRFPQLAVAAATVAAVVALAVATGLIGPSGAEGRRGIEDDFVRLDDDVPAGTADPGADPGELVGAAAEAMAAVTSVEFRLDCTGAPVYIDQFQSIALDELIGQFSIPRRAAARLQVEVDGSLTTRIGAIAIDDEVWVSNPVTGAFETLPPSYDLDPSRFFDPDQGWRPLLESLDDVRLVGIDDRSGERYHLTGVAPASQVANITAGLVNDADLTIELWVHPITFVVTAAEFTTTFDAEPTAWNLELQRYGEPFTIEPPEGVS